MLNREMVSRISDETSIYIPTEEELRLMYRPHPVGFSPSVTRAIIEIKSRISSSAFGPGERIIEAEIANYLNISTERVREALRILAGEKIVDLVPNRGAFVAKLDPRGIAQLLGALSSITLMGITLFVAQHPDPTIEVRQAVEQALQRIADSTETSNRELFARVTEYHMLIHHLSGNPYLNYIYSRSAIVSFEPSLSSVFSLRARSDTVKIYSKITARILSGRASSACSALNSAIEKIQAEIR